MYHEKQGSEQVTFLLCPKCQTVIGVGYINKNICVASLNAKLLEQVESVQGCVSVSPKRLGNTEKLQRWIDLWSQARIIVG